MRGVLRILTIVVLLAGAFAVVPGVALAATSEDPTQTTIAASPLTVGVDGSSTITVTAKDSGGVNVGVGGDTVVFSTDTGTLSTPTSDNGDGTYTVTLTDTVLRTDTVSATINGVAVSGSADPQVVFTAGAATHIVVETAADGSGSAVGAQSIAELGTVTGFAITRDASGNFVGNPSVTWSLAGSTGGPVVGDLSGTTGTSVTFTGHKTGSATLHAVGAFTADSGLITVTAGTETTVRVETANDGSGLVVPSQPIQSGNSITVYAITRDASGNFVGNPSVSWSLTGATGVVAGDLVGAGASAVFTGHLVGTAAIHAVSGVLASVDSGTITVGVGPASQVRVETAANGGGSLVSSQSVTSGASITVYAITRDAAGNFLANPSVTWSLANVGGNVVVGDLVGGGASAIFTGHLVGSATIHAVSGVLTSVDSGTLTVTAGTGTQIRVETAADGGGIIIPAQGVSQGGTVTAYAISRDASGNFVANVAATWSLTGPTGGVVIGDLSTTSGLSTVFTGHVIGSAKIHAVATFPADSGLITVSAGTATKVRVETAPGGSGVVVPSQPIQSGNSLTVYAVERDASDNFVANVSPTWSLTGITSGVVNGDLVGAGASAILTGHVTGSAAIHAVSGVLTSVDSGTITVNVGPASQVRVETAANGSGTVVPSQSFTEASSAPVTVFAVTRDASNNYVGNPIVTWSFTGATGVVIGDLSTTSGASTVFTGHKVGTAAIHAVDGVLASVDSGIFTVSHGTPTQVVVETANDGSGNPVPLQSISQPSAVSAFAISRDASGNFVANIAVAWSLTGISGSVVSGDLVAAGDNKSAVFTAHAPGHATIHAVFSGLTSVDSGVITVTPGTATQIRIETQPDGSGTLVPSQGITQGQTITVYAISRDSIGNFINNVAADWSTASNTGGVVDTDVSPANGLSATFTGHVIGSATIHAIDGVFNADSGTITVSAGTATTVDVETAADGSGVTVPAQGIQELGTVTGYAISRDASGNFVANVAATWSLANVVNGPSGGPVAGDLVAAGDTKSATFTGHIVGSATLHVVSGLLVTTDSGVITVSHGTATKVQVETVVDGSGIVVLPQNLPSLTTLTVYAISRDAAGNFVANVSATWSLTGTAGGGVVAGDLSSLTGTSTALTGHQTGHAVIHAVVSGLTSVDSGVITVIASPPATPDAPTATNGDKTSSKVTWVVPPDGGSPITGFTVKTVLGPTKTCTVSGATATSCRVYGLTAGTAYTFTVHATNAQGSTPESLPSNSVTPVAGSIPGAPTGVIGTGGAASATIIWVAPTDDGGSVISRYDVTSNPPSTGCFTLGALTCTVSGLTNNTPYTFSVKATNISGQGPAGTSGSVTPRAGAMYFALTPNRIVNTVSGSGALLSYVAQTFPVIDLLPGDTAHNVPSTATAITGVLSVHASTAAGFVSITVDPTNSPTTSTINFPKGDNRSTGVTVPLKNDGTLAMTYGAVANNSVQVTLDVTGYFAPVTGGASYRALTTNRILDSRPGKTNTGFLGPLASGTAKSFTVINRVLSDTSQNVPATAVAVTGVLTVTGQTKAGFVTIGPDNLNAPPTSTVWVPVGDIRATGITVKLGSGGALWVTYTSSSTPGTTHVIFDVTGCFVPGSSGAMYVPVTPKRIVDSRPTGSGHTRTGLPGSLKAYRGVTFQVTGLPYIPPTATAVTGSLTVVNQTAAGFLSLTKTAVNVPTTSNMNFPKGDVRATGVTAPLGPGGIMGVTYGASPSTMITDVLFDVTGYFVP